MKKFGNERTSLRLSPKAYESYITSTPCDIYEHEDESGELSYSIRGIIDRDGMTAVEINKLLEKLDYERRKKLTVTNINGTQIHYDTSVVYMDDELREELHRALAPCTEQEFFSAYEAAHAEKYGEVWELSKDNPCF